MHKQHSSLWYLLSFYDTRLLKVTEHERLLSSFSNVLFFSCICPYPKGSARELHFILFLDISSTGIAVSTTRHVEHDLIIDK